MTYPDAAAVAAIDATATGRVGPATTTATLKHGELSWLGVRENPVELHKSAGLDRVLYAIARCVQSEYASGPGAALLSMAEALRWEAKRRGCDEYQLLTWRSSSAYTWTHGKYGEQKGRHASTRLDPTARTVAAARASSSSNLTGGAGRWFGPRTQDSGRQGSTTLEKDAITVARSWGSQGWRWIGPLPGVDSYTHAVMRKGDPTDNAELVALIELGRRGAATVGASSPHAPTAAVARAGVPWWLLAAGGAAVLLSRA